MDDSKDDNPVIDIRKYLKEVNVGKGTEPRFDMSKEDGSLSFEPDFLRPEHRAIALEILIGNAYGLSLALVQRRPEGFPEVDVDTTRMTTYRNSAEVLLNDLDYVGFDWHWSLARGLPSRGGAGKITVRMAKFLKTYYNYTVSKNSYELANFGEVVRRYMIPPKKYSLDYTNSFTWSDGEFGDSGSCLWSRSGVRYEMMECGTFASRYYSADVGKENWRGMGRCWLFPGWRKPWLMVATNFYGPMQAEQHCGLICEQLSEAFGTPFEYWSVASAKCCWNTDMYFNGDARLIVPSKVLTGTRPKIRSVRICRAATDFYKAGLRRVYHSNFEDTNYDGDGDDYDDWDED